MAVPPLASALACPASAGHPSVRVARGEGAATDGPRRPGRIRVASVLRGDPPAARLRPEDRWLADPAVLLLEADGDSPVDLPAEHVSGARDDVDGNFRASANQEQFVKASPCDL